MQDPPTPAPRWILHPALFAAAFVLQFALSNEIEPAGFARSLVIAVLVAVCVTLAAWALMRDRWLGGLTATSVILATISFIPLFEAWELLHRILGSLATQAVIGLMLFAAVAAPVIQRMRVRRGAAPIRGPLTSGLNQFAAIVVLVVIGFNVGPDLPGTVAHALRPAEPVSVSPEPDLPDIYVLLLDGYPRADVLEEDFGIDNSPFLGELEHLGFDVGIDSHSNYTFTQSTLASMFQMRHLEDVAGVAPLIGQPGVHVNALRNAVVDAPAFAALRAAGYEIVVTQPGYEHVALRGAADRVLEHGEMNDLERGLLNRTWLMEPLSLLVPTLVSGPPRDRVVNAFDDLGRLATEPHDQPLFAWIHLPAPHLPLVLDAEGKPLHLDPRRYFGHDAATFGMTEAQFAAAYAEELSYLNLRVLGAVNAIQESPGRPNPVIVVMSDHGYTADRTDVPAQLRNLFAAFTPAAPGLLADVPTPINVMTILLNRFLGTSYPMSADRYFISPGEYQLLELTEVPNPN
jgi:hypothetical protein